MKETKKVTIVLEIELSGEVQDLLDKVANRVHSMDKVEAVTAEMLVPQENVVTLTMID